MHGLRCPNLKSLENTDLKLSQTMADDQTSFTSITECSQKRFFHVAPRLLKVKAVEEVDEGLRGAEIFKTTGEVHLSRGKFTGSHFSLDGESSDVELCHSRV